MAENVFSNLSDDLVLKIFFNLEDDPQDWARLVCVCTKFSSLIHTFCWKSKCYQTIPSLVSDLLSATVTTSPPGGWAALYKICVCCPGLLQAGVPLGIREAGHSDDYKDSVVSQLGNSNVSISNSVWSFEDDLLKDASASESQDIPKGVVVDNCDVDFNVCKRRKVCRLVGSHLASGGWDLSREQGNKLLASRFRGDCLYICDWPGCVHTEEKRNYMLFRGIFKNLKGSRVWRSLSDGDRNKVDLKCAFCSCKHTWDLHSAFCLRRAFGFHDDGEPVVRAYVCENGHVSGAWTDWPLYT